MTPDPLTLASIERCAESGHPCGCHTSLYHPWRLCGYHEGYEDGIEAARRGDEATR